MGDPKIETENLTIGQLFRRLHNRTARLGRLVELRAPKNVVSNEIDLVLHALEEIEKRHGDRDGAARIRAAVQIDIEREIEEAGGREAWLKKFDETLDAEDAALDANEAVKH